MELEHYIVRKATKDDCGAIHKLIQVQYSFEDFYFHNSSLQLDLKKLFDASFF